MFTIVGKDKTWLVEKVSDPSKLPEGVPLWESEEEAKLAGSLMNSEYGCSRQLPFQLMFDEVSK